MNVFISDLAIGWHSLAYQYGKKCLQIGHFCPLLVCAVIRSHTQALLTQCLPEHLDASEVDGRICFNRTQAAGGKDRIIYWDETRPGFGLMVTRTGKRSFLFQYRNSRGESRRATLIGTTKLPAAHKWADILQGEVARGADPVAKKKTERAEQSKRGKFKTIAEEYIKRESAKMRSMDQRIAILNRLVYPEIGDKVATKLKRSDIVALLDKIEDERGAPMADNTLMVIRRICNWHAARDDEFRSPIVRGMGRSTPGERARTRILTDDEIRTLWETADGIEGPPSLVMFAKLLQFILLTGVRRLEGARMDRRERNGTEWLIPAARVKAKRDFLVPLSKAAAELLEGLPVIGAKKPGQSLPATESAPLPPLTSVRKPSTRSVDFPIGPFMTCAGRRDRS